MIPVIMENLKLIGIAMALFVGAVAANTLLGLYNNVCILLQPFDKNKLINTGLKTACVAVGTTLLVVVVTLLPLFCSEVGLTIPDEYIDVFNNLTIIGAAVFPTCKYVKDAYDKLCNILKNVNEGLTKSEKA